jgi:hypothetical protein
VFFLLVFYSIHAAILSGLGWFRVSTKTMMRRAAYRNRR